MTSPEWGFSFAITDEWEMVVHAGSFEDGIETFISLHSPIIDANDLSIEPSFSIMLEKLPENISLKSFIERTDSLKPFLDNVDSISAVNNGVCLRHKYTDDLGEHTVFNYFVVNSGIGCLIILDTTTEVLSNIQEEFFRIMRSIQLKPYGWWLYQIRQKGLALTEEEYNLTRNNPDTLNHRKLELAGRYNEIISGIHKYRDCLKVFYNNARDSSELQLIEYQGWYFLETCLDYILLPLWSGGDWDINGFASSPHNGNIACGWFMQRIMEGLGFNLVKSKGLHLAHLASDEQVWSYSGLYSDNLKNWTGMKDYIEAKGYGYFIIGMSSGWGHVLFLRYYPDGAKLFYHAGPSPRGARVTHDLAENYVNDFMKPDVIHAVYLDQKMVIKWLTGDEIYPIKTKSYSGESYWENWRIVKTQEGLKSLGYFAGEIDHKFGPETREALRNFQFANSLNQTLLPDNPTIEKISHLLNNR